MKIGIIGINMFTHGLNFACPLHTFAFQQYLKKIGYDSTVISYVPNYDDGFDQEHPSDFYRKKVELWTKKLEQATAKNDTEGIVLASNKIALHSSNQAGYAAIYKEREIRFKKFWDFINANYNKTDEIYNSTSLETAELDYDCYFAVTDVIWGKTDFGYDPGFFLACSAMDNSWKISYSASMLVTENEEDVKLTSDWIKDQDFVSVREDSLQKRLLNNIRTDSTWVVDPVLLHKADFYNKIAVDPAEGKYLFLYFVVDKDPYIISKAIEYAEKYGLKIIATADQPNLSKRFEGKNIEWIFKYDIGVEEWLGYIKNAEVVFTNSFHCCCFSTVFHKLFFAQKRKYDKVSMFLGSLDLCDRIIDEEYDFNIQPLQQIDWSVVEKKLDERRSISECFLKNALYTAGQNPHPKRDTESLKRKQEYKLWYNIGTNITKLEGHTVLDKNEYDGSFFIRPRSIEYLSKDSSTFNNETKKFKDTMFKVSDKFVFEGWRLRIVYGTPREQVLLLDDGNYIERSMYKKTEHEKVKVFKPGDTIPYIPINRIRAVVAEAVWKPTGSEK